MSNQPGENMPLSHSLHVTIAILFVSLFARAEAPPARWMIEKVPFDRIPVYSGRAEDIGKSQGKREAKPIQSLVRGWLDPKLRALKLFAPGHVDRAEAAMEKFLSPDLRDEIRGLAAGAGIPFKTIVTANAFPDIAELTNRPFACSTLTIAPSRSAGGARLAFRNLDYGLSSSLRKAWRPVIFARPGKRRVLGIEVPGFVGILTGINDAGVMMSRMTSYNDDKTADGIPTTLLFREVLESASSVEEAIALFTREKRTVASNVMITDARDAAVLEVSATKYAVRRPGSPGTLYSANHFVTPEMADPKHEADERWPHLQRYDGSTTPVTLAELVDTACQAGRPKGHNILAVFVDYGAKKLWFGSDPSVKQKAACGTRFKEIELGGFLH